MAVDPHKNFAYSLVTNTPSTGGTTITVTGGTGTLFPVAATNSRSFNATVWPSAVQPTSTNAEIVTVTNVSTDSFTVTRAQEGTTAKDIQIGWQIAATITAHSLTAAETYLVNVRDYGAVGDGSTDDLTAIQNAITAAGNFETSNRGVDVFFPSGVYAVSGTITCYFNNVMLVGSGWESTVIYCTSITGDVIQFGDNTNVYAGCGLKSMSVWKSAQGTTGFNINIQKMNDVVITDFVVNNAFSGINVIGIGVVSPPPPPTSVKTWIQRGEINACAATGVGITINNANPAAAGDTYLDNLVFSQGGTTTGTAGINIINTGHCSIVRCNVTNYGTGLLVNPGNTQSVNYLFIDHCLFDTCDRAAEFSSTGATPGVIKSTVCVNSWFSGSALDYGIYFNGSTAASVDGFVFTACRILNNRQHGVLITQAQNINFTACVISGNGQQTINTYDGINMAAGISAVSVLGCRICPSGTGSNQQRYAINAGGVASSELKFLNNDLTPNGTLGTNEYINIQAVLTGTGNEIGSPIQQMVWRPDSGVLGLNIVTSGTMVQNSIYLHGVVFRNYVSAYRMNWPTYAVTSMAATASSASGGHTFSICVYSRGFGASTTRLESLLSRSAYVNYSISSNTGISVTHPLVTISNSTAVSTSQYGGASGYLSSSVQGGRMLVLPLSTTFSPGEYWFAFAKSTTTANWTAGITAISVPTINASNVGAAWAHWGMNSTASMQFPGMYGYFPTTSAAFPATIAISNQIRASASQQVPYFELWGYVTNLSML